MLVALRWMSQGGRSRHSLTLLLCTDCTAVWKNQLFQISYSGWIRLQPASWLRGYLTLHNIRARWSGQGLPFFAFTSPRAPLRILIGISYPSPTAAAAPSTHEVLPACRGALAPALVVHVWAATGLRSRQPVRATLNAGARVRPATGSPVVFATS